MSNRMFKVVTSVLLMASLFWIIVAFDRGYSTEYESSYDDDLYGDYGYS